MLIARKKKKENWEANVVENISKNTLYINHSIMVSKGNLVGSNLREWRIDTGVTQYICS